MTVASRSLAICHIGLANMPPVLDPFGGAIQRRTWELARCQAQRGHRVWVYSVGRTRETRTVDGVTIEYLPVRLPLPLGQLEFQWRALRHAKRHLRRVDLLHAHSQPEAAVMARSVSRGLARAVFLSYDYFLFRGGRRTALFGLYRRALLTFDRLFPVSDYCRDASAAYWQLPTERLTILHNGVHLDQFAPDAAAGHAERAAIPGDGPVVLYVGRVNEQKGTDVLIDAVQTLRARGLTFRAVIAGPIGQFGVGHSDGSWESRLAAAGITYLGAVEEQRLRGIYNMADVFVMPTRELEMFGMSAVEAQACGKPVICTDHGGLPETVPTTAGVHVAPGDAAPLANAIADLLQDPARRQALADGALTSAARFAWERICERIELLFRATVHS